jgi:hypothetical protein
MISGKVGEVGRNDLHSQFAFKGSISWKTSIARRPWEVARIVLGFILYCSPILEAFVSFRFTEGRSCTCEGPDTLSRTSRWRLWNQLACRPYQIKSQRNCR